MKLDKLPDSTDLVKVEVQVMNSVQHRRQDLIGLEKVPQIGSRVRPADGAGAHGIDWVRVVLIFRVPDHDVAILCEEPAVSRMTGGHDAVKHVHTARDCLDKSR